MSVLCWLGLHCWKLVGANVTHYLWEEGGQPYKRETNAFWQCTRRGCEEVKTKVFEGEFRMRTDDDEQVDELRKMFRQ